MSILLKLPDDIFSHVVGFLPPRDFYTAKTVMSSGLSTRQRDYINCYYWWREEVSIGRAALANCASLVRWIGENDRGLTPAELLHAATQGAQVAVYEVCRNRFTPALPTLLEQWVDADNIDMFKFQMAIAPRSITSDVFDAIYTQERWGHLACAFQYAPRAFVTWSHIDATAIADPDVISNLKYVLHALDARSRGVLTRVLRKYHDWLWTRVDRLAALQTISALHALEAGGAQVVPFHPAAYFGRAVRAPTHDFLEYLLLRGLEVEPEMLKHSCDIKKLKLLMTAQVVQKYQKIMVMLLVLIAAIVMSVLQTACRHSSRKLKINTR